MPLPREGQTILSKAHNLFADNGGARGFTILELLVVVAVISMLTAILVPSLAKVKRQAQRILGVSNQKQVAQGVSTFAVDNNDRLPDSVATISTSWSWNWQEPMMLTGYRPHPEGMYRSMSAYLGDYIEDAEAMYCPAAPKKYRYLQDSWDARDAWDNPETAPTEDPVSGTYCFYWNYTGYLQDYRFLFKGPQTSSGARGQSKLLMSDYFGYNHHRSRNSWGSCEKFNRTSITRGTVLSSAYWSRKRTMDDTLEQIDVTLNAAYTDGHVESYGADDVTTMKAIWKPDINEPYPEGIGPGHFFLPRKGLR
jgi:prepilin-type N-terminal cleavage/methylation domain-containing protein